MTDSATATRTVVADAYSWMTRRDDDPTKYAHHTAFRGEVIEVSAAEAERGEGLGALGTAADLALADALEADGGAAGVDDAQLRGYNVDELVAYLGQHPTEADRVADLENERAKPRVTVLTAVDRTRDLLAAELEAREAAALAEAAAGASGAPEGP